MREVHDMEYDTMVSKIREGMDKSVRALQSELQKLRTGRASTSILEDIRVDSYGSQVPLNQVATLAAPESRLITINPFDKSMLSGIEKAILVSGLGLTPANDGKIIRIPIPALSEERRKDLAKQVKKISEEAKVAIRHHRQEGNNKLKNAKKDGIPEDQVRRITDEVQKVTDQFIKKVDELSAAKEKEILTL